MNDQPTQVPVAPQPKTIEVKVPSSLPKKSVALREPITQTVLRVIHTGEVIMCGRQYRPCIIVDVNQDYIVVEAAPNEDGTPFSMEASSRVGDQGRYHGIYMVVTSVSGPRVSMAFAGFDKKALKGKANKKRFKRVRAAQREAEGLRAARDLMQQVNTGATDGDVQDQAET